MYIAIVMMKYPLKTVHGHSHPELEVLLEDSCNAFDNSIKLDHNSMGGWSNINIRGQSSELDFVLKLPALSTEFHTNPYKMQYSWSLFFNQLDIAARPIEIGRLSDSTETPFFIVEYIEGITHSSIENASDEEILSLKESHEILKKETPNGLPKFDSPIDYLSTIRSLVQDHIWLPNASKELGKLLHRYESVLPHLISSTETIGDWSQDTMHGDLWVPNIVFRPELTALFLDFEACAKGDSCYDLAYLLEAHETVNIAQLSNLYTDADTHLINALRPVVLACIIDWSIARLLSMESGTIEPNLNTPRIRTMMLEYSQKKINRLKSLLN
jgi:thiamine kinase-like enzyme